MVSATQLMSSTCKLEQYLNVLRLTSVSDVCRYQLIYNVEFMRQIRL